MKKITSIFAIGLIAMMPLVSMAQQGVVQPPTQPLSFESVLGILNTLIAWIFTLLLIVSTFLIFYAAWLYLTSAGDEGKTTQARNTLIYAVVGIAVALLAQGVRFLAQQLVQRNV